MNSPRVIAGQELATDDAVLMVLGGSVTSSGPITQGLPRVIGTPEIPSPPPGSTPTTSLETTPGLITQGALIIREMPQARHEFLRFQVGRMEKRPEQIPIYEPDRFIANGNRVVEYRDDGNTAMVFHLLGWGPTLATAEKMAGTPRGIDNMAGGNELKPSPRGII